MYHQVSISLYCLKPFEKPLTRNESDMDFSMALGSICWSLWVCMESSRSSTLGPETVTIHTGDWQQIQVQFRCFNG